MPFASKPERVRKRETSGQWPVITWTLACNVWLSWYIKVAPGSHYPNIVRMVVSSSRPCSTSHPNTFLSSSLSIQPVFFSRSAHTLPFLPHVPSEFVPHSRVVSRVHSRTENDEKKNEVNVWMGGEPYQEFLTRTVATPCRKSIWQSSKFFTRTSHATGIVDEV